MAEFKFYYDKQPLYSYEQVCSDMESSIYNNRTEEIHSLFYDLEAYTKDISYRYEEKEAKKKYNHYIGYTLEFLLPRVILKQQYNLLISEVQKHVLQNKKLPSFGYVKRKGSARYLVLVIGQRAYYEKEREIKVLITKHAYRDSITKRMCGVDNPNAEILYQPGDVKKRYMSNWSKKVRLFEMPKREFRLLCMRMEQMFHRALVKLNVVDRTMNFFRGIKQFQYERQGKRLIYVNLNINAYNNVIYQMNLEYNKLYDILYSPAKFYQEKGVLQAFQQLQQIYYQKLKQKRFTYHEHTTLSISPFIRKDHFMDNIETFLSEFINDCNNFMQKYITWTSCPC